MAYCIDIKELVDLINPLSKRYEKGLLIDEPLTIEELMKALPHINFIKHGNYDLFAKNEPETYIKIIGNFTSFNRNNKDTILIDLHINEEDPNTWLDLNNRAKLIALMCDKREYAYVDIQGKFKTQFFAKYFNETDTLISNDIVINNKISNKDFNLINDNVTQKSFSQTIPWEKLPIEKPSVEDYCEKLANKEFGILKNMDESMWENEKFLTCYQRLNYPELQNLPLHIFYNIKFFENLIVSKTNFATAWYLHYALLYETQYPSQNTFFYSKDNSEKATVHESEPRENLKNYNKDTNLKRLMKKHALNISLKQVKEINTKIKAEIFDNPSYIEVLIKEKMALHYYDLASASVRTNKTVLEVIFSILKKSNNSVENKITTNFYQYLPKAFLKDEINFKFILRNVLEHALLPLSADDINKGLLKTESEILSVSHNVLLSGWLGKKEKVFEYAHLFINNGLYDKNFSKIYAYLSEELKDDIDILTLFIRIKPHIYFDYKPAHQENWEIFKLFIRRERFLSLMQLPQKPLLSLSRHEDKAYVIEHIPEILSSRYCPASWLEDITLLPYGAKEFSKITIKPKLWDALCNDEVLSLKLIQQNLQLYKLLPEKAKMYVSVLNFMIENLDDESMAHLPASAWSNQDTTLSILNKKPKGATKMNPQFWLDESFMLRLFSQIDTKTISTEVLEYAPEICQKFLIQNHFTIGQYYKKLHSILIKTKLEKDLKTPKKIEKLIKI